MLGIFRMTSSFEPTLWLLLVLGLLQVRRDILVLGQNYIVNLASNCIILPQNHIILSPNESRSETRSRPKVSPKLGVGTKEISWRWDSPPPPLASVGVKKHQNRGFPQLETGGTLFHTQCLIRSKSM